MSSCHTIEPGYFSPQMASIHEMTSPFFAIIGDIGGAELLLIFVLVLVLFGGKRLPDFARGLGRSIREFKKATSGVEEEIRRVMEEPPPPPRKQAAAIATPAQAALPPAADAPTGVLTEEHAYDYDHDHYDQDPYHASSDPAVDPHHPGPATPATADPGMTDSGEGSATGSVTPTGAQPAAPAASSDVATPQTNDGDSSTPSAPKEPGSPQG